MTSFDRFLGAEKYIADEALLASVNAAIALERPLLVRGEPGTGKTMLARAIAETLGSRFSGGTSSRRPPRLRACTAMTWFSVCGSTSPKTLAEMSLTFGPTSRWVCSGRRFRLMSRLSC